jgi:hypothetical protein
MAFGVPFPNLQRQRQLGWRSPAEKQMDERLRRQQREQERRDRLKRPGEWP